MGLGMLDRQTNKQYSLAYFGSCFLLQLPATFSGALCKVKLLRQAKV